MYVIKDTFARVNIFGYNVNNNLFKEFNKKEQMAILHHEEYHNKLFTSLKYIYYLLRFRSIKEAKWQEEFDADLYASRKTGKEPVKSFLEKTGYRTKAVVFAAFPLKRDQERWQSIHLPKITKHVSQIRYNPLIIGEKTPAVIYTCELGKVSTSA